jgi:hypothetical protein
MEATCLSETSVDFQRITRRYIPEDRTLHNDRWENHKSFIIVQFFTALTLYEQRTILDDMWMKGMHTHAHMHTHTESRISD